MWMAAERRCQSGEAMRFDKIHARLNAVNAVQRSEHYEVHTVISLFNVVSLSLSCHWTTCQDTPIFNVGKPIHRIFPRQIR